jgi:hypothetical protein
MTAINPARLKIQSAELSEYYSDPDSFISRLHDLLDFYAIRVRQTGISKPNILLQSYQVPPPVLRALGRELNEPLNSHPSQGLLLIDALWEEEWLEIRTLAVNLLGALPPVNPESVFKRIRSWLSSKQSGSVRHILTTRGVNRLSRENPELVLEFFQDLLSTPNKENYQAVLSGMIPFAQDQTFENLPLMYKLLDKILLVEEKGLIKEILAVLIILIKRSEVETLYFLERQVVVASKPRILRVTRQILPYFSEGNQSALKKTLESYN